MVVMMMEDAAIGSEELDPELSLMFRDISQFKDSEIPKAIEIIRNTEAESEVIPNLMIGFGIDEEQAEFVAEIKLRNINREYIP